jgi:hypothetical protein
MDQWPTGLGAKALFCSCVFLSASSPFSTERQRESNANRQAVAKIFSFSPSHSFSLVFFSISFRPKRQPKTLSEEQLVASTTYRQTHAPMLFDN